MRIGLADVKKRISRGNGDPSIIPYLLRRDERAPEIDALVALYEAFLGRERMDFPSDRPAELLGDYRLARCLTICLEEWYAWRPVAWPGRASAVETEALAARGIDSPSRLRLALYDAVSARGAGYLGAGEREAALDACAADLAIARSTLDDLLALDDEKHAVLGRIALEAPASAALATRYNQQVFEALLANSSHVEWRIAAPPAAGSAIALGTMVKRICYLARRMGVQYDVDFAADGAISTAAAGEADTALARVAERPALYVVKDGAGEPNARPHGDLARAPLRMTLYGPQEVTGAPQQYGERLARLCRALLGYRRADSQAGRAALDGAELSGAAWVYLHGRPITCPLDARMLRLLAPAGRAKSAARGGPPLEAEFDSTLEEQLSNEFTALERAGEAHGWRIEREPEPIVVGDVILVPDFSLTRGARRAYLEIAGYWRPEYRERKLRKLRAVLHAVDIVVAAPEAARAEFAPLAGDLPLLWYRTAVGATALLATIDHAYDDFADRLAQLDFERIRREVQDRGCVAPTEALAMLHCYSRGEQARILKLWPRRAGAGSDDAPVWVDGVGLCAPGWLANMLDQVRRAVLRAPTGRLPFAELAGASDTPGTMSEGALETLVRMAGLRVARSSLFAAEAVAPNAAEDDDAAAEAPQRQAPTPKMPRAAQPRRSARRTQRETMTTPSLFQPAEGAGSGDA
jgi:predicted nuclease of restriction endonuclease-like RecB superfamily